MRVWMVRAGAKAKLLEQFLSKQVVNIGWEETGDLSNVKSRDEIRQRLETSNPDDKPMAIVTAAGMIARFVLELEPNKDLIITYDPSTRVYHVGRCAGPYQFRPDVTPDHPHTRAVVWERTFSRDQFGTEARYTLGAIQTLFEVNGAAKEELMALYANQTPDNANTSTAVAPEIAQEEETQLEEIRRDTFERAAELIKDKVQRLSWEQMQELVAGILRALGYKTLVSVRGPDQGKDIVASRDGLGLEPPRIKVEVKHRRNQQMGSQDVRSFIGGLHRDDRGLYISTGGFSREAVYEAERSQVPITLVDLDRLVDLVVQHYEAFDADTKALIPLVRVYWPAG